MSSTGNGWTPARGTSCLARGIVTGWPRGRYRNDSLTSGCTVDEMHETARGLKHRSDLAAVLTKNRADPKLQGLRHVW
jgi:hypothetical protein